MSAPARHSDQAVRSLAADRLIAAGRARRAEAGSVTEMARSLLRDAREAGEREARQREVGAREAGEREAGKRQAARVRGAAGHGGITVRRRCPPGAAGRVVEVTPRPLAARHA
jgi:hypothetical protein